jgi:F0F1-type ATP synthase membrane subunit b/b'
VGHSSHSDTRPLGLSDIIAGGLIFLLLAWACFSLAGPDGVGFLKGLLNSERSYELLVSGALFLLVWLVVGELAAKPYLANHMLREEKTKGLKEKSIELKKEIESLKLEVVSELRTARLDGVKKRDEVLSSARKIANQVIEAEKVKIDKEWEKISDDLSDALSALVHHLYKAYVYDDTRGRWNVEDEDEDDY